MREPGITIKASELADVLALAEAQLVSLKSLSGSTHMIRRTDLQHFELSISKLWRDLENRSQHSDGAWVDATGLVHPQHTIDTSEPIKREDT